MWSPDIRPRSRFVYTVASAIVIALGLASRRFRNDLPAILSTNAGDILWALLIFLLIGLLAPRLPTVTVALAALAFAYLIEFSQLYHAPLIDGLRQTTIGGLILGFGFLWSDLVCYTVGIIIGALLESGRDSLPFWRILTPGNKRI